jgi:hypothetical protein
MVRVQSGWPTLILFAELAEPRKTTTGSFQRHERRTSSLRYSLPSGPRQSSKPIRELALGEWMAQGKILGIVTQNCVLSIGRNCKIDPARANFSEG